MITTSHALIGYLLYEKKSRKEKILAVIGSIVPDATLVFALPFLAITSYGRLMESLRLHEDIYVTEGDFLIGAMLNSVWLWMAIIAIGKFIWKPLLPFGVGAIVHVFADALTHQGSWAWNHLYPLNVPPIQGVFDFMNPWFLLVEHSVWACILAPRAWRSVHMKMAKSKYSISRQSFHRTRTCSVQPPAPNPPHTSSLRRFTNLQQRNSSLI